MPYPWGYELKLRFAGLQQVCRSDSAYNELDIKAAVLNMDGALDAGLRTWIAQNRHVAEHDKDRAGQKDCHFPEVLNLVQKYSDLDRT